jgi:1-acyl-sn-glycerol-3-phosphate acyltransferase
VPAFQGKAELVSQSHWQLWPTADIGRLLTDRLCAFPRRPDLFVRGARSFGALVLRAALKTYNRLEIAGRENLPVDRSFVMVANHSSHLDALCLLSALPLRTLNRTYPAAAEDYFFVSLPRLMAAAIFVNAMPFGRQHHVRQSIDLCRRLLRERGNILILFPEGTRSSDGQLGCFRPGIGSLLAGLNVPVVPCAIVGANRAMPKGTIIPRPRKLYLNIGQPRSYGDLESSKEAAREVSSALHDAVKELLCDCQNRP